MGKFLLYSFSALPAVAAAVVTWLVQVSPEELKGIEGMAGVYALLFLVFKELISLVKYFKKDPNTESIQNQAAAYHTLSKEMTAQTVLIQQSTNDLRTFLEAVTSSHSESMKAIGEASQTFINVGKKLQRLIPTAKRRKS